MANIITLLRFPLSAALLFLSALSPAFLAVYAAAGVTDMIDGFVARKTHTESTFGARLDSAADIVFVAVCLVKLLPALGLPMWAYFCTVGIALLRVGNIAPGYKKYKHFTALHTAANRLTGLMLFMLPFTVTAVDISFSAAVVCAAASFASLQEGYIICSGKAAAN